MKFRNLGRSGLRVSAIGLGCNNFAARCDLAATRAVIGRAFDLGITLFDTADIYGETEAGERGGSEAYMGEVFAGSFGSSWKDHRKRIVLATKFGKPMSSDRTRQGASRRWIMEAVEDSLRRLRTGWIDLYQLHESDPQTPIEETLRALDDLTRQGKIRYFGCSNMPAWQVVRAHWVAKSLGTEGFVSCQDQYSLLVRDPEAELIPAMRAHGLGLLPYFPLADGLLTGKYRRRAPMPEGARLTKSDKAAQRTLSERNWRVAEALFEFAEARGHTPVELAFSWLLAQDPVASVIAGATRPEQLEQNVRAGGWPLSAPDLEEIDRITAE
jgi:aryl-alcohol dehydrogenase-like predicted oxidoreductase